VGSHKWLFLCRLLEDVENRVDNTQSKLKGALKRVEKVYKESNEKGSLLCIGGLVRENPISS